MTTNLVTVFNDQFSEFVADIQSIFPTDPDILTAKNALLAIRKANPKLLVKIWFKYVYNPYKEHINAGDIHFFLTKDYSRDLVKNENADKIRDECREPRDILEYMMRTKNVVKEENKEKIKKMVADLDKDEIDWSSNTSSDRSAMR